VKLVSAEAATTGKSAEDILTTADGLSLKFEIQNLEKPRRLDCTLQLLSESGDFLAASSSMQLNNSLDHDISKNIIEAGELVQFSTSLPGGIFNQGSYRINMLVIEEGKSLVFRFDDLLKLSFTTSERKEGTWMGQAKSHFLPVLDWKLRFLG
jgi:hypothetical protein